jgi:hypothetical protein
MRHAVTATERDLAALEAVVALARRVRTMEGVRTYNRPIGAIIGGGSNEEFAQKVEDHNIRRAEITGVPLPENKKPNLGSEAKDDQNGNRNISLVHLQSLLRQLKRSMKLGDDSQVLMLKRQLRDEITKFARGKSAEAVLAKLDQMGT